FRHRNGSEAGLVGAGRGPRCRGHRFLALPAGASASARARSLAGCHNRREPGRVRPLSSPGADAITSLVATLIAGPSLPGLDDRAIERVQGALASGQPPDWLAPGLAADVLFAAPDHDLRALADRGRAALAGAPIDVVVQRTAGR